MEGVREESAGCGVGSWVCCSGVLGSLLGDEVNIIEGTQMI